MPKILASKLDKARFAFDESVKSLVAQMRKKADKILSGPSKEDAIKFMPESFESWVHGHPDFTRVDFANSKWGELATIDWIDPVNKTLAMHRAYQALREEEKETLKSWKNMA